MTIGDIVCMSATKNSLLFVVVGVNCPHYILVPMTGGQAIICHRKEFHSPKLGQLLRRFEGVTQVATTTSYAFNKHLNDENRIRLTLNEMIRIRKKNLRA